MDGPQFRILPVLSYALRLVGVLLIILGVFVLARELKIYSKAHEFKYEFSDAGSPVSPDQQLLLSDILWLVTGVCSLVFGLQMFATGEIIGVLLAIEANTKKAAMESIAGQR